MHQISADPLKTLGKDNVLTKNLWNTQPEQSAPIFKTVKTPVQIVHKTCVRVA